MQEYTQDFKLNFISNFDEIEDRLSQMKSDFEKITSGNFDEKGKSVQENSKEESGIKFAESINQFVEGNNFLSELVTVKLPTTWGSMVAKLSKSLLNLFTKAWDEIDEMFSYNYLSDSSVRNLRLTYGLDAGEAYAYDKIADIMGISSLEDFSMMSTEERELFYKYYDKFYDMFQQYGSDADLSDSWLEFKVSMEALKVEMLQPLLKIINDETVKDNIKKLIGLLPDFLEKLIEFATNFLDRFIGTTEEDNEISEMYSDRLDEEHTKVPTYILKYKSTELSTAEKVKNIDYSELIRKIVVANAQSKSAVGNIVINNVVDGVKKSSTTYEITGNNQGYSNIIQGNTSY